VKSEGDRSGKGATQLDGVASELKGDAALGYIAIRRVGKGSGVERVAKRDGAVVWAVRSQPDDGGGWGVAKALVFVRFRVSGC
jgi:hypothetical protein